MNKTKIISLLNKTFWLCTFGLLVSITYKQYPIIMYSALLYLGGLSALAQMILKRKWKNKLVKEG